MQQVQAQQIGTIAVDLRNNPGGNAAVTFAFIKYLSFKSFAIQFRPSSQLLSSYPVLRWLLGYPAENIGYYMRPEK